MKKFLTFINEVGHYPTPIKQIYDIIETFCINELTKYINKKGKFYNYNIKEKQSYLSSYQPITNKYNYKDEISSQLKTSFSKLVKKAISLHIKIGLKIQKDIKSIDPELFRDYIKFNLTHELTHAYQDYQQKIKNIKFSNVWDSMHQIARYNWSVVKDSDTLTDFFWLIYKTSFPELNADISASLVKWIDGMDELITTLYNFNPEESYKNIIFELENNNYDIDLVNKNFGKNFIKVYKNACKLEKVKPNPKILNLENKDMQYILNYWSKIFEKRFEYLKKKLKLKQI